MHEPRSEEELFGSSRSVSKQFSGKMELSSEYAASYGTLNCPEMPIAVSQPLESVDGYSRSLELITDTFLLRDGSLITSHADACQ